jgi:DNA topoisomerase I
MATAINVLRHADFEFGATPDPEALSAAKAADLRYVSDKQTGFRREKRRGHFIYLDRSGVEIVDRHVLDRIKALAVPPAWTDVWICDSPNGHLQATGKDARGRKQYRYHHRWRTVRDETKFTHILEFAKALPSIRRHLSEDLELPGLPREKVLAAVVRLMQLTLARVGNPEYARDNNSFGLTTLKNHHVRIGRGKIELDFKAKSNIRYHAVVSDRKLARILKNCRDLPGSELFGFIDENGQHHSIDSSDLNAYLRAISGTDISAKDFRTWAATNLALFEFCRLAEARPSKSGELMVVRRVAEQLGNTATVCRKCYIHPAVIAGYHSGNLTARLADIMNGNFEPEIWMAERKVIRFLETAPDMSLTETLKRSIKKSSTKRKEKASAMSV